MSALSPDLESVLAQLYFLVDALSSLMSPVSPTSHTDDATTRGSPSSPTLAYTMAHNEIILLLYHDNSSLPSVCPCNMTNALDTKTHWLAKELHCIMGCYKFWNNKTILQVSRNGKWVNGGQFPPSFGLFATIQKAKRGFPLNWTTYRYLDAVHMDIAFGNSLSVGGFC
jgi:hypothetical protein